MANLKENIDVTALRAFFLEKLCPGIAALVEFVERKHPVSVGSMSIPDPDGLIDGVTNAVVRAFGIKEQFVTSAKAKQFLFGISAEDKTDGLHDSGLVIGPFWDPAGRRVEATPLQWLEALSRALPNLSPAAIAKVDGFCATVVHGTHHAIPLDTVDL